MSSRLLLFIVVLLPLGVLAQQAADNSVPVFNHETRTVLLANRPDRFTEAQWLEMMQKPANRALYPLRITPAMRDTLDLRSLDARFQYVAWKEDPDP